MFAFCQKRRRIIYVSTGLVLCASELWKQYTLTFVLGDGQYNWWYFPFQLCSVPMYLCLFLPFLGDENARTVQVFFADYTLLGGIFTFFDLNGMHYTLPLLTAHSYIWHIALIALGLFSGLGADFYFTWKRWRHATLLFSLCCLIAEIINTLVHSFAEINMFYISPFYPVTQTVFRDIAGVLGQTVSHVLYVGSIVLGSCLFHILFRFIQKCWIYKSKSLC